MSGFDYIRTMRNYYRPRTPRAAIIAAQEDLIPMDAIIYKGSSVKPLFEEPYDLEELERILAQRNLAFPDAMILSEIFAAMTRETDKERALFAAESLTMLENRWAKKVEDLRAMLDGTEKTDGGSGANGAAGDGDHDKKAFDLARALFEQALVTGRSAPIRNYYLRESYYVLSHREWTLHRDEAFNLRIRCLMGIGLLDQAEAEIVAELALTPSGGTNPVLIALAVETAYLRKDLRAIRGFLSHMDLASTGLSPELIAVLGTWQA